MNKFIFILLILTSISTRSQSIFNFKRDMVWIANANLYVCKYEVTNIEYREFTDQLLEDSLTLGRQQLIKDLYYPDTMVWIRQFNANMGKPMNEYYRWLPAFNGFPVVGLKYEAALKYCEWLTQKYGNGEYKFRLPTRKEFVQYSRVGSYSIAGGIECPRNEKRKYLINYKPNRTNLDDSVSKVFYNPKDKTFMRVFIDSTNQINDIWGIEPYTHYVENYFNGYLYISVDKNFFKYKVQDSITFYFKETDSFRKEKVILNTQPNYYDDGFMYSSPSRAMRNNENFAVFDENGEVSSNYDSQILFNKSTYPPDKNGLYDLAGNVSELTSEKGYAMGGNWNSVVSELRYDYVFEYQEPDVLVGFRVVAERLK